MNNLTKFDKFFKIKNRIKSSILKSLAKPMLSYVAKDSDIGDVFFEGCVGHNHDVKILQRYERRKNTSLTNAKHNRDKAGKPSIIMIDMSPITFKTLIGQLPKQDFIQLAYELGGHDVAFFKDYWEPTWITGKSIINWQDAYPNDGGDHVYGFDYACKKQKIPVKIDGTRDGIFNKNFICR